MGRLSLLLVLALSSTLLLPAEALAQKRVVVTDFDGPAGASIRSRVVRALDSHGVTVVPRREVAAVADRIGVGPDSEHGYAALARAARVDAFVSGVVVRGRGWGAAVQVRNGRDGSVAGEMRTRAARPQALARVVGRTAWRRLGGAIQHSERPRRGQVADVPTFEGEEPPPMDMSTDDVDQTRIDNLDDELFGDPADHELPPSMQASAPFEAEHSPLSVDASLRLRNRGFAYSDDPGGAGVPYDLPLGPALSFGAEWFPGAHFDNGAIAHLGVTAGYATSIALSSAGPNGVRYPTADSRIDLGLRYRIPIGERSRIAFDVAWGSHGFSVENETPRDPEPPIASVDYQHGRLGASARFGLGPLDVEIGGAWLAVYDTGEIGEAAAFPGASATGFAAELVVEYPVGSGLSLRGGADLRMYFLGFDPVEGADSPIGGATDRHLSFTAGASWTLDPDL